MKRKIILNVFVFTLMFWGIVPNLSAQTQTAAGSVPFSRGVNFNDWFETPNAESIMFSKYDEQDFIGVKKMGMDVIRLNININAMTSGSPNYTISPLLLKYIDQAVDWAEKNKLYIILVDHPLNMPPTPNDIDKVLIPVWTQMAQYYKDRSEYVLYEVMNEPNKISPQRWGKIQEDVINTIRKIDQQHWIVVGGVEWDSYKTLSSLPKYTDKKLLYTFHFYHPELLTMSSDFPINGEVPWPYDKNRMPKYNGNSISDRYTNYEKEASQENLLKQIDMVVSFSKQRNVPVFCGEWGTCMTSHNENGMRWHQFISNALNERNIPWTCGNYYGFYGMFNLYAKEKNINSDLNVEMVKATGFTPPPQTLQTPVVPGTGFTIFDNTYPSDCFVAEYTYHDNARGDYRVRQPLIDKFHDTYAIRWGNVPKYHSLTVIFKRITDLSKLVPAGYVLEIKACVEKPVGFHVRFMNSENANSIPWRMVYVIDEKVLPPDGNWHTIRIPLKNMWDGGAWVNATQQWVNSRGEFSWKQIRSLELAAEVSDLNGCNVWIESIKIVAP